MPVTQESQGPPTPRAIAAYELKKVQQRTAAIIVFAVVYPCVLTLIGAAKVIQDQGRGGDAYALAGIAVVIALLQTCGIRAILGHPIFSPIWTTLALAPPILGAIWYL